MTRYAQESVPKRRPPLRVVWLSVLALLVLGAAGSGAVGAPQMQAGSALAGPNLERSVKAAYLFKFLGYVEFSGEPGAALHVGVMAADDVAAEVTRLTAGRTVNGRPVTVRALRDGDATAGLQMLFVGAGTERPVQTLRSAAQNGVLTVTDDENGLQQGAIINFRLVEERIRFEVSLPAAERSNLKLSSRLLSVAYHVQKGN